MNVSIWTLVTVNRHGTYNEAFGTQAEALKSAADYARERYGDELDDDLSDEEVVDACNSGLMEADNGYLGIEAHAITLTPPDDATKAAQAAVEALRYARDCLKVAKAPRALERVRLALSSADGAVRAAGYRAHRGA